jgi:hypothetical protein
MGRILPFAPVSTPAACGNSRSRFRIDQLPASHLHGSARRSALTRQPQAFAGTCPFELARGLRKYPLRHRPAVETGCPNTCPNLLPGASVLVFMQRLLAQCLD